MARPRLRALFCGPVTAVVLVAVGGCGGPADEAVNDAAAQPADAGSPPAAEGDASDSSAEGTDEAESGDDSGDDSGGSGDESADSDSADTDSADTDSADTDSGGGARPGGPDASAAGGEGPRPGGPFDVDAFEQEDADFYSGFLDEAVEHCADGRCSITYTGVPAGEATDACSFHFSYVPDKQVDPADPNHWLIQRGAHATIEITCPPPESADGTTDESTD